MPPAASDSANSLPSRWPSHAGAGGKPETPLEARRCTVQLSTGRLYLDAAATPATALLGHDLPRLRPTDEPTVRRMISSLAPGYTCVALAPSYSSAVALATNLARSVSAPSRRILEMNALDGGLPSSPDPNDLILAWENETLARTGRWLASAAWQRPPDFIVIGDALALGSPFGAALASETRAASLELSQMAGDVAARLLSTDFNSFGNSSARPRSGIVDEAVPSATLSRVAAAIGTVEKEGLLQHGRELADYLAARLAAVRETCPQIESISRAGLLFHIEVAPPLTASLVRRRMCERGVLVASREPKNGGEKSDLQKSDQHEGKHVENGERENDGQSNAEDTTLIINAPLTLRIAEADVITGALRGALLDSPMPTASAPCSACSS